MAAAGGGPEDCFIPDYFKENVPSCPMCGKVGGMNEEGNPYINDHEEWCDYMFKLPCKHSVPPQAPTEGGARRRVRRKSRKHRKHRKSRKSNKSRKNRSTRRK